MGKTSIAIVGCGTVGSATARILLQDKELLKEKSGIEIQLKYIAEKDPEKQKTPGIDPSLFIDDYRKALTDPEVSLVVELIGGIKQAKILTEEIIRHKKHVVTANKALLAHYGAELFSLAHQHGVSIAFEASCGGGIPIVRALTDGLLANRIDALYGIVNGTCNYILTEMIQKGKTYKEALSQAQKSGLAEADPTLDVSGEDSAHKLAILSSLAFGKRIDYSKIDIEGIDTMQPMDVEFGSGLGYVVKLLAVVHRIRTGICLRVRPVFISREHPLAWVSGPFNAVSVYGHANGHTMYYGRGAGGRPTASAIISDIITTALGTNQILFKNLGIWPQFSEQAEQVPVTEIYSRYYMRIMAEDHPGVLARIAKILGDHNISISSVLQKEISETLKDTEHVPIVITSHIAQEKMIQTALEKINRLSFLKAPSKVFNIIEEHAENMDEH